MLYIEPKVCRLKPSRRQWIFKAEKNQQQAFLRQENKATGIIAKDFTACYISLLNMKIYFARPNL
jgi:hypothetical protein